MKLEERTNIYVNSINSEPDIAGTLQTTVQAAITRIINNLAQEMVELGLNWHEAEDFKIIPKGFTRTERITPVYHPFAEISEGDLLVQDLVTGEKFTRSNPAYCEIQSAKDKPSGEPIEKWEIKEPQIPSKQTWYLPCFTLPLEQALEIKGEFYRTKTAQAKDNITVVQTDRLKCEQEIEFPLDIEFVGGQLYKTNVGELPGLELRLEESETEYEGRFRHEFEKPRFEYTGLKRCIAGVYRYLVEKRDVALSLALAIGGGVIGVTIGDTPTSKGMLSIAGMITGTVAFPAVIGSVSWGILNAVESIAYGISRIRYNSDSEELHREINRTVKEIEKMKQQDYQLPTEEKMIVALKY